LNRPPPHPIERRQNAYRQTRFRRIVGPPHGDRPLTDGHFAARRRQRNGELFIGRYLEQNQHPAVVAGDDFRRGSPAAGERYQDRRRLLHEIKRRGNHIAILRYNQPRGWSRSDQHFADHLQAANRFDLDDRRSDGGNGRLNRLLFGLFQVLRQGRSLAGEECDYQDGTLPTG
jgi:hypothetical protein